VSLLATRGFQKVLESDEWARSRGVRRIWFSPELARQNITRGTVATPLALEIFLAGVLMAMVTTSI